MRAGRQLPLRQAQEALERRGLEPPVGLVVDEDQHLLGRQRLEPALDQALQAVVVPEGPGGAAGAFLAPAPRAATRRTCGSR